MWDDRKIDGRNSDALAGAIASFQSMEGMPVTGQIEPWGRCINTLKRKLPAHSMLAMATVTSAAQVGIAVNPSISQVDAELAMLSGQFNVPLKALQALIEAESNYRQFDSSGQPLVSSNANSSAAGLGQATRTTANLYGESYQKLQNDWKYNLFVSVKVYAAGYHHAWNNKISDLRIRAARAYGMYHDGFEPDPAITGLPKDAYKRQPRGLLGSKWETRYLSFY